MEYIYLDQNKWIELLKGLNEGKDNYISLFKTIMLKVNAGEWAFPISVIHITETMKRKNEASRKMLLDLMFTISGGYSIADYATADILEFNAWVMEKTVNCKKLQKEIIQCDWTKIIGLSTANAEITFEDDNKPDKVRLVKDIICRHSCDREIFDNICSLCSYEPNDEKFYYECFVKGRESFIEWKEKIKKEPVYKDRHLFPAYLINVFFAEYKDKITNLPKELQENVRELFDKNSKNKTMAIENMESLSGFNIHNRLVFELYNNPYKSVHEHDFNDLAYLRVAIPYCDVVIGENYWCDRVKDKKLDQKYGTKISTNLFDLINV